MSAADAAAAPEEERAELAAIYEAKGLSAALAAQVADELTAKDALASQVEAEYGIDVERMPTPARTAITATFAFVLGSAVPLLSALLAPGTRASSPADPAALIGSKSSTTFKAVL